MISQQLPTACPFCGADLVEVTESGQTAGFKCFTSIRVGHTTSRIGQSRPCGRVERDRLTREVTRLLDRIKRLEDAGDFMAKYLTNGPYSPNLMHQQGERDLRVSVWNQAKEAKP